MESVCPVEGAREARMSTLSLQNTISRDSSAAGGRVAAPEKKVADVQPEGETDSFELLRARAAATATRRTSSCARVFPAPAAVGTRPSARPVPAPSSTPGMSFRKS